MNFFEFVSGGGTSFSKPINIHNADIDEFIDFTAKNGVVSICGKSFEVAGFCGKIKEKIKSKQGLFFRNFFIVSGNIQNVKTALPLDSKKAFSAGLKAWSLSRFDSKKAALVSFILTRFDFIFFYAIKFIFKNKFSLVINSERETFFSFLSRKSSISEDQLFFSVYGGSGKLIFPVFNLETGENSVYAKAYASGEKSGQYGENEAKALRFLKEFSFENADFPRVIFSGYFGNNLINVISSKSGLKNFKGISNAHIQWIKELAEKTGSKKLFEDSPFLKVIKEEIGFMKKKLAKNDFGVIARFYEKAVSVLSGKEFLFSFINGEFDFHELFFHREKNFAIDWERARNGFPPIFDVYNLILSNNVNLSKERDYRKMHIKSLNSAFFGENKKTEKIIDYFLRQWSIGEKEAYFFFVLFLVDRIYDFIFSGSDKDKEIVMEFLGEVGKNEEQYEQKWIKNANFV